MNIMLASAVMKALVVRDRTYIPHPAVIPTLPMIFLHADIHCETTPSFLNALYSALHVLELDCRYAHPTHDSALFKEATAVMRESLVDLRQCMAFPRLYE